MKNGFETRTVTLGRINVYEAVNVRELDENLVKEYAADMKAYGEESWCEAWGQKLRVVDEDGNLRLYSGFHTHRAAQSAFGNEHVLKVHVYEKDVKSVNPEHMTARLLATGQNATHGKRRTTQERQDAMDRWLLDPTTSNWSNRYIAKMCAVSHATVKERRRRLIAEGADANVVAPEERWGWKNGGKYVTSESVTSAQANAPQEEPAPEAKPAEVVFDMSEEVEEAPEPAPAEEAQEEAELEAEVDAPAEVSKPTPTAEEPCTEPLDADGIINRAYTVPLTQDMVDAMMDELKTLLDTEVGDSISLNSVAKSGEKLSKQLVMVLSAQVKDAVAQAASDEEAAQEAA